MALVDRFGRQLQCIGEYLENRSTFDYSERPNSGRKITQGGVYNSTTGLGTPLDKSEATFFNPTRFYWRTPLEILYVQSSVAKKFINIPVDDMFIRWRSWVGDDANASE